MKSMQENLFTYQMMWSLWIDCEVNAGKSVHISDDVVVMDRL